MKKSIATLVCILAFATAMVAGALAGGKEGAGTPVLHSTDPASMRVAGEQRFHANCGRCHAAPQKFPPRMMGTILRHMRVRATITDEDRRLILYYMTQ